MEQQRTSLRPMQQVQKKLRQRLGLKGEFALALLPTVVILGMLSLVEVLSRQRCKKQPLASSAFLIYLDPHHATNTVRTLVVSQLLVASLGFAFDLALGPGYLAGGGAMVLTIVLMILLDVVYPPAVSTSLSFAFRSASEQSLLVFMLAVCIIAVLVALQRSAVWVLARYMPSTEQRPQQLQRQ